MEKRKTYTKSLELKKERILSQVKMETSYAGAKNLKGNLYDELRTTDADNEYLDGKMESAWNEARLLMSEFEKDHVQDQTGWTMTLELPESMPEATVADMLAAVERMIVRRVTAEWMRNIDASMSQYYETMAESERERIIHDRCQRRRQERVRMQPF